jgi:flagellar basal body rod protein FlgG
MGTGIAELGEILLARSEQRLETVSRNVSNLTTPGFKREVPFMEGVAGPSVDGTADADATQKLGGQTDFAQGALRLTGSPLDLAMTGPGFFQVRSEDQFYYVRGGQFLRGADGRISNALGHTLQTVSGGDLILDGSDVEILTDGVVLQGGTPVARIGVFNTTDGADLISAGGGLFVSQGGEMTEVETSSIRQGMLESSNVELAEEMLTMMDALRQAESGARLIRLYDSLIGQSVTTFGQTR